MQNILLSFKPILCQGLSEIKSVYNLVAMGFRPVFKKTLSRHIGAFIAVLNHFLLCRKMQRQYLHFQIYFTNILKM